MPKRATAVTVEDLVATLPLRALAAFSACSARLVQSRATEYFARDDEGGRRADAVRLAAVLAEKVASGETPDAIEVEGIGEAVVEALMAVGAAAAERDDQETREAAFATNCAYAAVDAAAAACAAAAADDPLEDARRVLVAATTGWEAARSIDDLLDPVAAAVKDELDRQIAAAGDESTVAFPDIGPAIDLAKLIEAADVARSEAAEEGRRRDRPDDVGRLREALTASEVEIARLREELVEAESAKEEAEEAARQAAEPANGRRSEDDAELDVERERLGEVEAAYRAKFERVASVVGKLSQRRETLAGRERAVADARAECDDLRVDCERERAELTCQADALVADRERFAADQDRLVAERDSIVEERASLAEERAAVDAERDRLHSDRAAYAEELAAWHAARARCDEAVATLREAAAAYEDAIDPVAAAAR